MDYAKLIADARRVVSWNRADEITGRDDDLLGDLADALEECQAKLPIAWSMGEATGWSSAMRHMSDEPSLGRQTENPYDGEAKP